MAAMRRALVEVLAAALLCGLVAGCGTVTAWRTGPSSTVAGRSARPSVDPASGLPYIDLDRLPVQARHTVRLIEAGGPFPYDEDGDAFANREGILPEEPRGYYHEYTVPTPGETDRGARRIVAGDHDRILYYTDDHYRSFARIRR